MECLPRSDFVLQANTFNYVPYPAEQSGHKEKHNVMPICLKALIDESLFLK